MSTVLEVIEGALRDINVISEIDSASAEQGAHGLRKLNQMMAFWKETEDTDLGYFAQPNTTGTIPIPAWSELGVTAALSLLLAPRYGKTISAEQGAVLNTAVTRMQSKLMIDKKEGVDLSYLPVGSGKYGRGNNILTDS